MSTVFFDSYTRNENGGIYVEYRSGNTVYEECFSDGELTTSGLVTEIGTAIDSKVFIAKKVNQ